MKIKFIEPSNAKQDPFAQCWYTPDQKRFAIPLLAFPILAALTPQDWQIELVDEKIHTVDLSASADLICMSFKTKDAKRAYRYADHFRSKGIKVILGGMHASLVPDEAAEHADAVVAGEAEGVWKKVIEDFKKNSLQKIYRAPKMVPLESAPIPRFDLLDNDRYCVHAIQTARGCLVGCEFCPIQEMFEGKSRHKPVARILQEIEAVRKIDPNKDIFFTDEMFCGGDRKFQSELLRELRRNKVNFYCISDFKVMDPQYIMELASSGCKKISINMPGTCLPQELKAVRSIQKLGIDVWGFFMFGFSFHDRKVFDKVIRFVEESGMKNLTLTVMSPFPNTPMARRIGERNGIFSTDWDLYDQCHVAYKPEKMEPEELTAGFLYAWQRLENRLYIKEEEMYRKDRNARAVRRIWGMLSLGIEKIWDKLRGYKEEPVDLEVILGRKKAEVSITSHNVMGERHGKQTSAA